MNPLRKYPLVSIVILNYNSRKFLGRCLSSVFKTNYPNYEVIFVDNHSNDGSVDFVIQNFRDKKNFKVIRLPKNYGFSVGNNVGAKHARGEYIVFLNPDTEVDRDWIRNLINVLETDSSIGIAQAKLLMLDHKDIIDHAGGFINPYGFVSVRGRKEKDMGQYDKISEIDFASGAAMIVRRSLWKKLGGFDPIFFIYYEDIDLSRRAWDIGYKVVCVPQAKVYHVGSAVLRKVPYILKYNEAKGRLTFLLKKYSFKSILRYASFTFLLQLLNALRYAVKGDKTVAMAICRGTFWCLRNFKKIWLKKKQQDFMKTVDQTHVSE